MQTFLPHADFRTSAAVLDDRRLGKQRVEAYQILKTLSGASTGWVNHPAVKMWRGHELALLDYTLEVCDEWLTRGFRDSVHSRLCMLDVPQNPAVPPWLGDDDLHVSHRSNLLRKEPEWYAQFDWRVSPSLPYVWPVK